MEQMVTSPNYSYVFNFEREFEHEEVGGTVVGGWKGASTKKRTFCTWDLLSRLGWSVGSEPDLT